MTELQMALIASVLGISGVSAQEINCANAQVQMELTFCAERDWMIADADLNDAYKAAQAVMKGIDADNPATKNEASSDLRDAQRAWVTYRDAACSAEGFLWYGGSGEQMVIYACRARITRDRAADLWALTEGY